METISKTSGELISDIDRHYKEICKERGIDLTAEQEHISESEKTEGKEPALSTSNVQQETLTYYVAECIYNTGSRTGLIDSLSEMRGELSPEETELLALTDSTLSKLRAMTDDEFAVLELYPDFDE